jgi:hypothetical protein
MIHSPEWLPKIDEKGRRNLLSIANSPEIKRAGEIARITSFPGIYFTRQVSIDELKKWINKNRDIIRAIQYKLPKQKIIKRNQRTLFWGQVAWILKQDGINSWAKMRDYIDKMNKEKPFVKEEESDPVFDPLPTEIDLAKYYTYFVESLKQLSHS